MQAVQDALKRVLKSPRLRYKDSLDQLVEDALSSFDKSKATAEIRRSLWEYALRNEVFTLAVRILLLLYLYVS